MAPPRDDTTEALEVRPFAFGAARSGGPALEQGEVTELDLLVEAISGAFELTGAATPRRPWPDPLAEHVVLADLPATGDDDVRSEEHTSELQSLMRISSAVFCLKKKN